MKRITRLLSGSPKGRLSLLLNHRRRRRSATNKNNNAHIFPNNLPPELLAEVFTLACDHKKTTPFTLAHVCANWRTIVWSTPELWSHISLRLVSPQLQPAKYARQITAFKNHLSLSGGCALTLVLSVQRENPGYRHRPWDGTNPVPVDFVQLLAESMCRWQSVEFDEVPTMAWRPVLEEALSASGLPYLHTVKIIKPSKEYLYNGASNGDSEDEWAWGWGGAVGFGPPLIIAMQPDSSVEDVDEVYNGPPPGVPWRFDLFSVATALRTVYLRSCLVPDVDLPWDQLTSLTLRGIHCQECILALDKAENLTYLKITRFPRQYGTTDELPSGRCLHPVLEHLVLGRHTVNFLDQLSAPSLHTLEIRAGNVNWDPLTLPRLIDAMGCHLRRLILRKLRIPSKWTPEINIVHMVREISSLEDLEVSMKRRYDRAEPVVDTASHATDADLLVELLKPHPDTNIHFLPNLTRFSYAGPLKATSARFHDTIFQQLQFRIGSAGAERNLRPLLSFSVDTRKGYNPLSAADKSLLRELREGGLHLGLSGSECKDDVDTDYEYTSDD